MGAAGTASNTYAGGTVIMSPRSSSYLAGLIYGKKNGAFGTGDVTVEPRGRVLFEDRGANDDMIDNRASYLQSSGTNYARITLSSGVAETIAGLYFDGVAQAEGTWGSSSSVASKKNDSWFAGAGILTVKQARVVRCERRFRRSKNRGL